MIKFVLLRDIIFSIMYINLLITINLTKKQYKKQWTRNIKHSHPQNKQDMYVQIVNKLLN